MLDTVTQAISLTLLLRIYCKEIRHVEGLTHSAYYYRILYEKVENRKGLVATTFYTHAQLLSHTLKYSLPASCSRWEQIQKPTARHYAE